MPSPLALASALAMAACSGGVKTVTLKGQLALPPTDGVSSPPANPAVGNQPLLVTNVAGTLGKTGGVTTSGTGGFQFDVRTDTLPAAGDTIRLAWLHPTKGGILLERVYALAQGQSGELDGDLSETSTLVALAVANQQQIDPSVLALGPVVLEQQLVQTASTPKTTLVSAFRAAYYGYLASNSAAPGANADLAQSATDYFFPR